MEGPLPPALVRLVLLLLGTALWAGAGLLAETDLPDVDWRTVVVLLLLVAVGALPLRTRPVRVVQALVEAVALGLVIGAAGEVGLLFAPLLLVPALTAGREAGLPAGAATGLLGGLAWAGGLALPSSPEVQGPVRDVLQWTVVLVATGLIGGWLRRLTVQNRTYSDIAYEDAFRLLTELQEVARNLSLGLDPATLGSALLDEVAAVHPGGRRTLAVRSGEGRLTPLAAAGDRTEDGLDVEVSRAAWTSGRHESVVDPQGGRRDAYPVRMGTQVVAVLTLRADGSSAVDAAVIEGLVSDAGPRLATALLFDEVRQLATVDERLRLAREIHDGIAQDLASVGYLLDDVADRVPPEAAEELRGLRSHVRSVVNELRLSIFDLRSGVDENVGLGTALTEHVQRVGQQSRLVVHTVVDEHGDRLPAGTEVELLRIAQEAVTNVRKHAHAANLWVECSVAAPHARLRIADDGVGLQPATPASMGLRGMNERAQRIGAELSVGEREGGGTLVDVRLGEWAKDRTQHEQPGREPQ